MSAAVSFEIEYVHYCFDNIFHLCRLDGRLKTGRLLTDLSRPSEFNTKGNRAWDLNPESLDSNASLRHTFI